MKIEYYIIKRGREIAENNAEKYSTLPNGRQISEDADLSFIIEEYCGKDMSNQETLTEQSDTALKKTVGQLISNKQKNREKGN